MKLQFDANQQFQLDAISAVTELFDGQPQGAPEYSVIKMGDMGGLFAGQDRTELGVGNRLLLDESKLLANTRAVQTRNDIDVADAAAALEAWTIFDTPASMATSNPEDAPRGMEFLYSSNRLNVAISRAQGVAVIVASPSLFKVQCKTPRQMDLANSFCRFLEMAQTA